MNDGNNSASMPAAFHESEFTSAKIRAFRAEHIKSLDSPASVTAWAQLEHAAQIAETNELIKAQLVNAESIREYRRGEDSEAKVILCDALAALRTMSGDLSSNLKALLGAAKNAIADPAAIPALSEVVALLEKHPDLDPAAVAPSAADLDRVAADERAKQATAGSGAVAQADGHAGNSQADTV